jgi:putative endonuclease
VAGWLKKLLGDRGERTAARYLRRQGFKILARQYSNRFGEVDLIALDGDWVVFVEVKTRQNAAAGLPVEAVTPEKQSRLTRAALAFLKARGLLEARARFDVVAVMWPANSKRPEIEHYRNAFPPVGSGQMYS